MPNAVASTLSSWYMNLYGFRRVNANIHAGSTSQPCMNNPLLTDTELVCELNYFKN